MNSLKHKFMKNMTNDQKTLFLLRIPYINSFKFHKVYQKNIDLIGGNPKDKIDYEKEYKSSYNKNTGKFNVNIDNNKYYYKVERYSSGENETNEDKEFKFIDLITIKDKYKENIHCGSIAIDIINNTATITSLGSNEKCLKSKNNVEFKYGDILFQIMIYICKKENINKIELTDNSYKKCGNNILNLNYLKTLTHGFPHYYKYGFKYKNEDDNTILKNNHIKFLTDPKININNLITLIKNKSKNKNAIDKSINILNKYEKKYNIDKISIKKFVKILTLDIFNIEFCELIECIYVNLFKLSGYEPYYTKDLELNLK
jgi:hypothetical protein